MGNIANNIADVENVEQNTIEILFEVQALKHDNFVAGNTYRISVGSLYSSESFVTVAQDDLTFNEYTPSPVRISRNLYLVVLLVTQLRVDTCCR